jgi:uncharacterized RDD family membrane protein YckC
MLSALDLSGLFSTKNRVSGDYGRWRPFFYGLMDPVDFLLTSVDSVRGGVSSDEEDEGHALHWLGQARDLYGSSGGDLSQRSRDQLVELLVKALGCPMNARERSQVCYLLRALGHSGAFSTKGRGLAPNTLSSEGPLVFSVVLEFDAGGCPTLIYAGSDRFAAAYWEGGSAKIPPYEASAASEIALKAVSASSSLLDRLDLASGPDSFDPPELPPVGSVLVSVITDRGVYSKVLPVAGLSQGGLTSLYNPMVSLLKALLSQGGSRSEASHAGQGSSSESGAFVVEEQPRPFVPQDPCWKYPTISRRVAAFLVDAVFYTFFFSVLSYFLWPAFDRWPYLISVLAKVCLVMLLPLLAAWMESSADWAYASLGKRLVGIRVLSTHTSLGPLFPQALARNLAKWYLSPLFLGTGFLWAGFHPLRRTWHDLLGDTVVIIRPVSVGDDPDVLPEIVVPLGGSSSKPSGHGRGPVPVLLSEISPLALSRKPSLPEVKVEVKADAKAPGGSATKTKG